MRKLFFWVLLDLRNNGTFSRYSLQSIFYFVEILLHSSENITSTFLYINIHTNIVYTVFRRYVETQRTKLVRKLWDNKPEENSCWTMSFSTQDSVFVHSKYVIGTFTSVLSIAWHCYFYQRKVPCKGKWWEYVR